MKGNPQGNIMKIRKLAGFSLIELLVTIAVVGILSTLALTTYSVSIKKAKRVEAKGALFKAMQQEERFFTQNNSYTEFGKSSTDPNASAFSWYSADSPHKSSYELNAVACKDSAIQYCVEIVAVPGSANVDRNFQDIECGKFSITSTGIKSFSGSASKDLCW